MSRGFRPAGARLRCAPGGPFRAAHEKSPPARARIGGNEVSAAARPADDGTGSGFGRRAAGTTDPKTAYGGGPPHGRRKSAGTTGPDTKGRRTACGYCWIFTSCSR